MTGPELHAQPKVGAIILGAGKGQRMGGFDKVFAPILGIPLIAHSVEVFESSPLVHQIVLVLSATNLNKGLRLLEDRGWTKTREICLGGQRRRDSVAEGLKRLSGCQWVVIHDGVRPCVRAELIEKGLSEAKKTGAAIAAVPAIDTIKMVDDRGMVIETPRRQSLWQVQTPQVFRFDIIEKAHQNSSEDASDDAALVERLGHKVMVFMGSYDNIKVTTPRDLAMVEFLLRRGKVV
ncbi:MAG: 2-C-methyl-D-erythritol 4-phosphate cytidylyltransferase [Chloroflexi bacterium]|nr:2-C-methyl-D-erythritol 4-phosphate cytidylyltransferase [Chloroflexota bacterium]